MLLESRRALAFDGAAKTQFGFLFFFPEQGSAPLTAFEHTSTPL